MAKERGMSEKKPTKHIEKKKSLKSGGSKTEKTVKKSAKNTDDDIPRKRYFKVIDPETMETIGRYVGQTPKQAANKGYSKYVGRAKKNGEKIPKKKEIFIRESTNGSAKKVYGYLSQRDILKEPQIIKLKNKDTGKPIIDPKTGKQKKIIYKYRNRTRKIEVPEDLKNYRSRQKSEKKASKSKTAKSAKKSKSTKNSKTAKTAKTAKNTRSKKAEK